MNFFSSKRFVIWVIVILVIINISALVTIIIQKCGHVSYGICKQRQDEFIFSGRGRHPNIHYFIKNKLGLNDGQIVKFKNFMDEYRENSKELLDSLRVKRVEMLKELSLSELDTQKLCKIADEIGSMHATLKRLTIKHFLQMLSLCSAEQKEKLLKLFQDMEGCKGHNEEGCRLPDHRDRVGVGGMRKIHNKKFFEYYKDNKEN